MAEVPKVPMDIDETSGISAESGDGDRQVLAPSEGPREELINTAIKFLQNTKVMGSPLNQKKAFLTKKGLTQEEVDLAVERAGVTETSSNVVMNQARPPPPGYQPGMMAPYGQVQPPIPPQSGWARVRDLTLTSVVVAGVSYALYHFYKTYLEPYIRGKTVQDKRLDRLELQVEEIHKSVNESLSEISRTLGAIQLSVNSQSQQSTSQTVGRGITDLKADISSLRSLLLSKNQFPAPPTTAPMLPSWQLAGASSDGSRSTNGPSSLSPPNPSPPATSKTSSPSSAAPSGGMFSTSAEMSDTDKKEEKDLGESTFESNNSQTEEAHQAAGSSNGREAETDTGS